MAYHLKSLHFCMILQIKHQTYFLRLFGVYKKCKNFNIVITKWNTVVCSLVLSACYITYKKILLLTMSDSIFVKLVFDWQEQPIHSTDTLYALLVDMQFSNFFLLCFVRYWVAYWGLYVTRMERICFLAPCYCTILEYLNTVMAQKDSL